MAAKIHLNDGSQFVVDESFDEFERIYARALTNGGLFRIANGSGKVYVINAAHVSRIENLSSEAEDPAAARPQTVR